MSGTNRMPGRGKPRADQKAALWLFAFSLRDPSQQQLVARGYLASVQ